MKFSACLFIFLLLSLSFFNVKAQDISKLKLTTKDKTYNYYEIKSSVPTKGLLILLPALGEKPNSIFNKTMLPKYLTLKGYVTVIPEISAQMFADSACIRELDQLIKLKTTQYKLRYQDIVIGGLSDGGAMALCYTEYLGSKSDTRKLKAVFAVDPPADLSRVYASAEKETGYNCPLIVREGKQTKTYLENVMDASPAKNPDNYIRRSAYSAASPDGGNAKFLKDTPVRLYSEPDLEFVQKTYCPELQYFNLNAYDLEKMDAFLKSIGNKRSEYITTKGKGFHSWNIVDAEEFAKWVAGL